METRIKLSVKGLTSTQTQVGAYALILAEENGSRRIPIIVGASEAQSIAIAMERIMTDIMYTAGGTAKKVVVTAKMVQEGLK